jgi:hypothetical protein
LRDPTLANSSLLGRPKRDLLAPNWLNLQSLACQPSAQRASRVARARNSSREAALSSYSSSFYSSSTCSSYSSSSSSSYYYYYYYYYYYTESCNAYLLASVSRTYMR